MKRGRFFLYLFENQLEIHISLANSMIILGLIFSLVALLYKLDLIIPSFKTIFFSKFVIISLLAKVLFFISLYISNFLDLLIGIKIFKPFLNFQYFLM